MKMKERADLGWVHTKLTKQKHNRNETQTPCFLTYLQQVHNYAVWAHQMFVFSATLPIPNTKW